MYVSLSLLQVGELVAGRVLPLQTLRKSVQETGDREGDGPLPLTLFLWLQLRADPNSASRFFILSQAANQPL